jgi:hypothetical protein
LRARLLLVVAPLLCIVAVSGGHAGAAAAAERAEAPRIEELGRGPVSIHDSVVQNRRALRELWSRDPFGGPVQANTGEWVVVYLSSAYAADVRILQAWANFLAGLVHGRELAEVKVYVLAPGEVRAVCGSRALACYDDRSETMVVPGENARDGTPFEEVAAHEYGHQVAANRNNDPWPAVDWGTKRWATHLGICPGVRSGTFFPSYGTSYARHPGEGFAEAYREMMGRMAKAPAGRPWVTVDSIFYPDPLAGSLLVQDVLEPWLGPTTRTWRGRLRSARRAFVRTLATPLDGVLRVTLRSTRSMTVRVTTTSGRVLAAARAARGTPGRVEYSVCGERSLVARVRGRTGSFSLAVQAP